MLVNTTKQNQVMQPGLCLSEKSKEPWLYSATVRPPIPLISKKPLEVQACWRCDGLKVNMLKPRPCGAIVNIVFLCEICYSYSAPLHPGVKATCKFNVGE